MNLELIKGSIPQPFVDPRKGVNIPALCEALQLDRAQLPKASGASKQSIAYHFKEHRCVRLRKDELGGFIRKLILFHALVTAVIGKDAPRKDVIKWVHSPNKALGLKSPADLIYEKRLDGLIEKLKDILFAAQGA